MNESTSEQEDEPQDLWKTHTSYNKTKNFKWNGFFLMITTNPDNKFPMSITIVQMKIHNII
jgi:hypothetical protein